MLTVSDTDGVVVVQMDDGKANALGHDMLTALREAVREAKSAKAVVITGRPGRLSAGFDLSVMRAGPKAVAELVSFGANVLLDVFTHPRPVVVASSGHAVAAGAALLLSADYAVAADGAFQIGLNEVTIGLSMPEFIFELARRRVSPPWLDRVALHSEMLVPTQALLAGLVDELAVSEDLQQAALRHANRLGDLSAKAFAGTKNFSRVLLAERLRQGLSADLSRALRESA